MLANNLPPLPRIVSIGGGQGVSLVLAGLRPFASNLVGVIAVTDTGRSTGKVRTLANIPAPGDVRNVVANLADPTNAWVPLLQHRLVLPAFEALDGVAFGNLVLAALTQMTGGDFAQAVGVFSQLVNLPITILPVTNANTHLSAQLVDGTRLTQEFNVRQLHKAAIEKVFIEDPTARAYPPVLAALREADLITIGPGSLFTTVLACLAFPEVAEAIRTSPAKKIYICNTTTQPGQTDGYTVSAHVRQIVTCLGPAGLDYAIINTKMPTPEALAAYKADGVDFLMCAAPEVEAIRALGVQPILVEVAETVTAKRALWQKQDSIRHDPALLAQTILNVWNGKL